MLHILFQIVRLTVILWLIMDYPFVKSITPLMTRILLVFRQIFKWQFVKIFSLKEMVPC